jgi:excisionase family DNA binding protein
MSHNLGQRVAIAPSKPPYRPVPLADQHEPSVEGKVSEADSRRLLTTKEAAQFLSISDSYMRKLITSGTVRSIKLGAARRVPLLALVDFVDGCLADVD